MIYTFACPGTCSKIIKVNASNDEDAITKIIKAGAIGCRNREKQSCREQDFHYMFPLPEELLREIVRLNIKVEYPQNA
jgi:hypothetical protein